MTVVYYAVEGDTDVPVAEGLIQLVGRDPCPTSVAGGKSMDRGSLRAFEVTRHMQVLCCGRGDA